MSPASAHRFDELRPLLVLALPLIFSRIGSVLMSVVDVLSAGYLGGWAVATLGLASTTLFIAVIFPFGLLLGMDPLVSQAVGARRPDSAREALIASRWLVVVLTPLIALVYAWAPDLLLAAGQPPEYIADISTYLWIGILGTLPMLGFHVLSTYLAAHGHSRFLISVSVAANLLNLVLNYALVRGVFGFPSLGVAGLAIATVACQWLQFATVLWLLRRHGRYGHLNAPWRRPRRGMIASIVRTGLPVGAQYLLESSGFALTAFLIGRFAPEALAGHQVALNVAALFFMVALGLSGAASVRVGQAWGAGDAARARRAAWTAWGAGTLFSLVAAAFMFVGRHPIASWYLGDDPAAEVAALLLVVGAAFHVADAVQGIGFGILRGLGDTRIPVIFNAVGYYAVGIPLGLALLHWTDAGAAGLWWGLTAALFVVAALLVGRFVHQMRRAEHRPAILGLTL